MAKIKQIESREILNCNGDPTIETTVILSDGTSAFASVPSGTSVGSYEVFELRDRDEQRYDGLGVLKAIANVKDVIAPKLIGIEADKQQEIDRIMIELDGTQNKGRLGGNAILSVSIAVAKAGAQSSVLPLFLYLRQFAKQDSTHSQVSVKIPTPLFNLINGGKHAEGSLDFQEFLIIPASSKQYSQGLQIASSIYKNLKKLLSSSNLSTLIGDEGGFNPKVATNQDAISLLLQAIDLSSLRANFDVFLGIDAAASTFYSDGKYMLKNSKPMSSKDLVNYYENLNKTSHLLYLEDALSQDDWEGWMEISSKISKETIIAGDDLTATNPYRLQMALDKKAITGIVIKPNQIGTVIETIAVCEIARKAGLKTIVSHRSGETNDDFIADFAVAVSADYVKFGAPARGERVEKYNRLLQIENQIKAL